MNPLVSIIVKRFGLGVLTMMAISVMVFLGVEALPGDTAEAILGKEATPETVAALRKELKLDLPAHVRYLSWLQDFSQGDFGISLANRRPIAEMIGWRIKNSLFLAASAASVAIPLSVFLGMMAAVYRNSWFDRFISMSALGAVSFPEFFVAYILVTAFAINFHLFPSVCKLGIDMSLLDSLWQMVLPVATLTLVTIAHMMRMTRAAIINVLSNAYIETAILKGIKWKRIIVLHAFRNSISPVINVIAMTMAYLIAGVVVVEVVFVYPGLGQLMVDSVYKRDLPVTQACGLIFACTYVLLNLIADILAKFSSPKLLHPK